MITNLNKYVRDNTLTFKNWTFNVENIEADKRCTLLYSNPDIYTSPLAFPALEVQTYYEAKNISGSGVTKYIRFTIH